MLPDADCARNIDVDVFVVIVAVVAAVGRPRVVGIDQALVIRPTPTPQLQLSWMDDTLYLFFCT